MPPRLVIVLCLLGAFAPRALSGPESAAVDRTIGREPTYESSRPFYALLVLGQARESRVWLVVDGDQLHVDRNGDGDLVDEGEKLTSPTVATDVLTPRRLTWRVPTLLGSERYSELAVVFGFLDRTWTPAPVASNRRKMRAFMQAAAEIPHAQLSHVSVRIDGRITQQSLNATFGTSPLDAPVFHMDGPLTLGVVEAMVPHELWLERDEQELKLAVGTPGEGPGSFSFVRYDSLPAGAKPVVELEFPAKTPGERLPATRVEIPDRC
jgi:hypothetical protein